MRTNPGNPDKVGRIIIPLVVPNEEDIDGDDVFKDSTFKPVWDILRALKAHDFRLEAELNRLRGLSALGPVSQEEFEEVTRVRCIGINALEAFHLRILEINIKFLVVAQRSYSQFVERKAMQSLLKGALKCTKENNLILITGLDTVEDLTWWRLSAERIDVLEALPGWEWDPLEVFIRSILVR